MVNGSKAAVRPDPVAVEFDDERLVAARGYAGCLGYHPLIATRAGSGEVLHARLRKGSAGSGRGALRFVSELLARVRRAGAAGEILIRADSGSFAANAAWTVIACLAHNLGRWTGLLGLNEESWRSARTIRRWLVALPGRLTHTARRWTLHLPARWPWRESFIEALTRIPALPAASTAPHRVDRPRSRPGHAFSLHSRQRIGGSRLSLCHLGTSCEVVASPRIRVDPCSG